MTLIISWTMLVVCIKRLNSAPCVTLRGSGASPPYAILGASSIGYASGCSRMSVRYEVLGPRQRDWAGLLAIEKPDRVVHPAKRDPMHVADIHDGSEAGAHRLRVDTERCQAHHVLNAPASHERSAGDRLREYFAGVPSPQPFVHRPDLWVAFVTRFSQVDLARA